MGSLPTFSGFPRAGFAFLADLAAHNNRAWFEAHKQEYQALLLEPAQAFVMTLGAQLQALSNGIRSDTRTAGMGLMTGIFKFPPATLAVYRDAVMDDLLGADLEDALETMRRAGQYTIAGEVGVS